jgi:hypothetical protein
MLYPSHSYEAEDVLTSTKSSLPLSPVKDRSATISFAGSVLAVTPKTIARKSALHRHPSHEGDGHVPHPPPSFDQWSANIRNSNEIH